MDQLRTHEQLAQKLAGQLGREPATRLAQAFSGLGEAQVQRFLLLLDELDGVSSKGLQAAIEALPEVQRRIGVDLAVAWLDLGLAMAESSGAASLRYFKESPLLLGLIEPVSAREQVLRSALELAEANPNVALEFLRIAPEVVPTLSAEQLPAWADFGSELAEVDYVLAIEYLRQMAAVAKVLPLEQVQSWVGFGMKLITQNSLGKTDYLATLEFFRTSPAILADIESAHARWALVQLGAEMAGRSPEAAIACLAEAPTLLRRLPSEEWQRRVLQYGTLVAEQDANTALAYLRRCPETLALIGDGDHRLAKFEAWFKAGMEILGYSIEGARAFFAAETAKALTSIEAAMSGVPLRQVARSLTLFAQALCGSDVRIEGLPEQLEQGAQLHRPKVSPDGKTIFLPSLLRRFPTFDENFRLYLAMTAHEAGHLEFGTFTVSIRELGDLTADLRERYRRSSRQEPTSLADLFSLYPKPAVIRDLWTILEDARVEYRLRQEYPGLSRDLETLARDAVQTRTLSHGMTVRELVVDQLLLLSTVPPGTVTVPDSVADVVGALWPLCQPVFSTTASSADAIRLAHEIYVRLEELLAVRPERIEQENERLQQEAAASPRASDEVTGDYQSLTNWDFRGTMDPESVREQPLADESERRAPSQADQTDSGLAGASRSSPSGAGTARGSQASTEGLGPGRRQQSTAEELLALEDQRSRPLEVLPQGGRVYRYPEWDSGLQDYRVGWCRLVERDAQEGSPDFVEQTLSAHHSSVLLLRRYFESLRLPALRRVSGQADGEDLDLDAAVTRVADLAAGGDPSERIYVRREKRERDVAAAFLIDVSGSTSRQIEQGRRVIDVEKEGLVLLCEALHAIGDQYAVYGYSGQGKELVDFLVMKDFDDPIGGRTAHRLGGIGPLHQNRDGAAVRHATRKLLARQAKTRLLVLISDGRPLDDGYKDDYSLDDTKMALREARMKGVDVFCLTIDRDADHYVKRMYGDVRYLVIDRVEALPERLPRIYQRLTA
jgi:hypothetical protein